MKRSKKLSSLILCMALIVAMALYTTGCNGNAGNTGKDTSPGTEMEGNGTSSDAKTTGDDTTSDAEIDTPQGNNVQTDVTELGEGSTQFPFTVVDKDGNETKFDIHTDKETVGEALLELKLIDGDEGEYGLFVKSVNGITADYDTDGVYWAFYINDEYAVTGVDSTPIQDGESYSFKVE